MSEPDLSPLELPLSKILERASDLLNKKLEFNAWGYCAGTESPIEQIFCITAVIMFDAWLGINVLNGDKLIKLYKQQAIGDYRVDFVLEVNDLKDPVRHAMLAIECDGHDFHERTKEQAANDRSRDRHLQSLGYTVFRFTGSQLWNDPVSCGQEVTDWAGRFWRNEQT